MKRFLVSLFALMAVTAFAGPAFAECAGATHTVTTEGDAVIAGPVTPAPPKTDQDG